MKKTKLTLAQLTIRADEIAQKIVKVSSIGESIQLYGVPRGGIPAALMVQSSIITLGRSCSIEDSPEHADFIIDDVIDSGMTKERYFAKYKIPFCALYDKTTEGDGRGWLVFPWEETEEKSAEDIPVRLLQYIGEDPERGGLEETPKRFLKAWDFYTSGYDQDPTEILKVFEDGAENYDQMVLVKDIPVWSHCEHHMAPFWGKAHIAYIPDGKVLGLSKLPRLVEIFARRLQVQERLTNQIAGAIWEHLKPKGVGVMLACRHTCIESRGIQRAGTVTVTSALRGVFLEKDEVREEYLQLIGLSNEGKL